MPKTTAARPGAEAGLAAARPVGTLKLAFRDAEEVGGFDDPMATDLSAAALTGSALWVANDERAHVERLVKLADGGFGRHRPYDLSALFELPTDDDEIDIEGLAADDGYLWVVGSHSKTRKKPEPMEHDPAAVLARLEDLKDNVNRCFLAKIPLVPEAGGDVFGLWPKHTDGDGRRRKARMLPMSTKHGNKLLKLIRKDEILAPFVKIPAKENGFDIEGIAVRGAHVLLGLRGPVIRGWAAILAVRAVEAKGDRLALEPLDGDGRLYHRHLLEIDGLGIRDLCWWDEDLLILAGPTLDVSGPIRLFRWRRPLASKGPCVLARDQIDHLFDLPFGLGEDHAEGLFLVDGEGGKPRLAVVYDSPRPERRHEGGNVVEVDLFDLAGAR